MSNAINETPNAHATQGVSKDSQKNGLDGGAGVVSRFFEYLEAFRAHGAIEIDGEEGDDQITAEGWAVRIDGGEGHDTIDASGYYIHVTGGQGDDKIHVSAPTLPDDFFHDPRHLIQHPMHPESHHPQAHHHPYAAARAYGGQGNDTIKGDGFTFGWGGAGDDSISIGGGRAIGGSGNDTLTNTGGSAELHGGAGDDVLSSTGKISVNSRLFGGAGDDILHASGSHAQLYGGTGDDQITLDGTDDTGFWHYSRHCGRHPVAEGLSEIQGGTGNDAISLTNDAEAMIRYNRGDGHDTINGARETTTVKFGSELRLQDALFTISGDDLTIAFPDHDGSLTFQNYPSDGLPMMAFSDGTIVDASTAIQYAGGDPENYHADDSTGEHVNAKAPSDADD